MGPALGHVGRSLVIARELSRKGNLEIHFAGASPGFAPRLIPEEYPFSPIPFTKWGEPTFSDKLETVIGELRPDLICLDLNPLSWLYLVRFPAVPQVYITNWFLTRLGPWETIQDHWFAQHGEPWNALRIERRLEPLNNSRQLYDRDLVLLCDPPDLFTEHQPIPSYMHLIGPCTWGLEGNLPRNFDSIDACIFVSFGSTGRKPLSPHIPESIGKLTDTDTIVWLGKESTPLEISADRHYRHLVYSWLPTWPILSKARFVITQGGTGSTYQALQKGIPVGTWPTHKNQELLGKIVQTAGIGVNLENSGVLEGTDAQYRLNDMMSAAQQLSAGTSIQDGPRNAAEKIMNLI